jgi:hypothetical protein
MKRQPEAWKEKLDDTGLRFLEAWREAHEAMPCAPANLKDLLTRGNPASEVFSRYPDLGEKRRVNITPEFLRLLESSGALPGLKGKLMEGENVLPPRLGAIFEWMQTIDLLISDPKARFVLLFWVSCVGVCTIDSLKGLQTMAYGQERLDMKKMKALAAQFFEVVANLFRGRYEFPKGRVDTDLMQLVNFLQAHQKEPLTAEDLRGALAYAGITVPEGDTWRVRLWRAKKKGLIKEPHGSNKPKDDPSSLGKADLTAFLESHMHDAAIAVLKLMKRLTPSRHRRPEASC